MKTRAELLVAFPITFAVLALLHFPFLHLSYFWDEAGYYIPAAVDFYRHGLLIPHLTEPNGHTPLLMIYVAALWRAFGFSRAAARLGMLMIAAWTVVVTYGLGKRVGGRAVGIAAAVLLALSPSFFAQSTLVYPSLAAALLTTLAVLFALDRRWVLVAVMLSLAVATKEIAVIAVPVFWAFLLLRARERRKSVWALSAAPVVLLGLWALYYHAKTGYWTGNAQYLHYNLYAALNPLHMARSFPERFVKVFVLGFDWVLTAGALVGLWKLRSGRPLRQALAANGEELLGDFLFLTVGLLAVYIVFLSAIGGALLSRYLLPVFPAFFVLCVALIGRLRRRTAMLVCALALAGFVASWQLNPPYPFPYDDNLAYASFVRLQERGARFLETLPHDPVILTAWPATDELTRPFLGYVKRPLRVAAVKDFSRGSFAPPPGFNVLYLYSRKWRPSDEGLGHLSWSGALMRLYGYKPAARPAVLATRFHLRLLKRFRDHGQWVRIYAKAGWK